MKFEYPVFESLPLDEVISINEVSVGVAKVILVGKSENSKFEFCFDKRDNFCLRFSKRLREQIDIAKKKSKELNHSIPERLEQLSLLFKSGLITTVEFESKKQEVLKSL